MNLKREPKPNNSEKTEPIKSGDLTIKANDLLSQNAKNIDKWFPLYLTLFYAISILIGMYYHDLWRDELDIYARLLHNGFLKYNGPSGCLEISFLLYYSMLHILLYFIPTFTAYKAYHFIIIVSAAYVFNRYSSFTKLQKVFFTFSYFMLFEYGVISRYYGFLILILFVITYLLTRKNKNFILISVLLIILANHCINAAIFAASLIIYFLIHIINGYQEKTFKSEEKRNILISLIILCVGCILLIFQYAYVYNVFFNQGQGFSGGIANYPLFISIKTLWSAYVPIPDFSKGANFWNTNFLTFPVGYEVIDYNSYKYLTPGNLFAFCISLSIIAFSIVMFSKKLPVLLIFMFNTIFYLIFMHFFVKIYFIRYLGLLFIIFVYCCWLYDYSDSDIFLFKKQLYKTKANSILFDNKLIMCAVTFLFFLQFIAGILTYPRGIMYQFTKSNEAANYLTKSKYNDYVWIGAIDYAVLPVAVITNKEIFLPQTMKFAMINDFYNVNRMPYPNLKQIIISGINFLNMNKHVLLILNTKLKNNKNEPLSQMIINNTLVLKKIAYFEGAVVLPDEQYYLYELKKL